METKANYLLIGVFTLASIFGAFALFVWLAKVNIDQQYAYFDVLFEDEHLILVNKPAYEHLA